MARKTSFATRFVVGFYLRSVATTAVLTGFGTAAVLALTAGRRGTKPLWFAVVLVAAVAQHCMLTYRVMMNQTMTANVLQTEFYETRDLLGWRIAARLRRCEWGNSVWSQGHCR